MGQRGHVLVWAKDEFTPDFILAMNPQEVEDFTNAYIEEVVTRYGTEMYAWDVVNEIIPDGHNNPDETIRDNIWTSVDNFVCKAF